MNKVILIGNLTRPPELRSTNSGASVCNFTLAVNRRFANAQGVREADFIPVVAWRQLAELCAKYLDKGSKCAVIGSIQTRSYDANDGTKRYVTEVLADEVEFIGRTNQSQGQDGPYVPGGFSGHMEPQNSAPTFGGAAFASADDEDLPF